MNQRPIRRRAGVAVSISISALCAGLFGLAAASPADAAIRCNSDGTPNSTSGKFTNNTNSARVVVTGDKKVSGVGWVTATSSLPVGANAWSYARICDVDLFTVNTSFQAYSSSFYGWRTYAAYTNLKSGPGSQYCWNYTSSTIRCSPAQL